MPTVSIILPTYNRTRFLVPAVKSVFAQTFDDWELIVADDGSNVETKAFLRTLDSRRVHILWLEHSGNPSRVRNAALGVASGRYVAFLDSDDLWVPRKLAAQVGAIGSSGRYRWSYTACDRVDADTRPLPAGSLATVAPRSGWIFEPLLALEVAVAMPTVVAERSLVEEVGRFDEEQRYGEFHDLSLRLALCSEVIALPDVLCSVRAHDEHYSADRVAAHRAWMRLYEKFSTLAPTAAGRASCERMRVRVALDLASLLAAKHDVRGVLRTLRAGRVWRHSSFWYRSALALLKPFVPDSWVARFRSLRSRGATA